MVEILFKKRREIVFGPCRQDFHPIQKMVEILFKKRREIVFGPCRQDFHPIPKMVEILFNPFPNNEF